MQMHSSSYYLVILYNDTRYQVEVASSFLLYPFLLDSTLVLGLKLSTSPIMGPNRFTNISSSSSVNNGLPTLVAKMPVIVCSKLIEGSKSRNRNLTYCSPGTCTEE